MDGALVQVGGQLKAHNVLWGLVLREFVTTIHRHTFLFDIHLLSQYIIDNLIIVVHVLQINTFELPAIYVLLYVYVCTTNQYLCTTNHLCTNGHLRVYYKSILLYYRPCMY